MQWQRFNAFHVIVLIRPITYLLNCEHRGYIDGFLSRLLNKKSLHRIIIVEEKEFEPLVRSWLSQEHSINGTPELHAKFGRKQLQQAVLATLYGTLMSRKLFFDSLSATLSAKFIPNWESVWERTYHDWAVQLKHRRFYSLTEDGLKRVQCVGDIHSDSEGTGQEPPELFQLSRRRRHVKLDEKWVNEVIRILADDQGWFTIPILYNHVRDRVQRGFDESRFRPEFLDDEEDTEDLRAQPFVMLPSISSLRRVSQKLVATGELPKTTWYREAGRPCTIYHLPGRLPLRENDKCGQCAFYVSLRCRCRLWWLLDKTFGTNDARWSKDGAHPLSLIELHKMRNSWRIGPHSSACSRFLDKKRDYRRKAFPENCDICLEALPVRASEPSRRCDNCGTRYFPVRNGIRVYTSYEHEFRRNYKEIAGREPGPDLKRWSEEQSGSIQSLLERAEYRSRHDNPGTPQNPYTRTLVVFPHDTMFAKGDKLFVLKTRKVEAVPVAGTVIVDHMSIEPEQRAILEAAGATIKDVPKDDQVISKSTPPSFDPRQVVDRIVRQNPEFIRRFTIAIAKSAINATRRIGILTKVNANEIERSTREQASFLRRLERADRPNLLSYEALVMREYWNCYDMVLKGALARFGPRKKSRFVRDYVTNPAGRARGYSAADAAINYMHQRRLLKCRLINVRLGLGWDSGDGFLHRRKLKERGEKGSSKEGMGLLLDLTDAFKFADREKLLEAILSHDLTWRDFYIAPDRQGINFYYPQPRAVDILELKGREADDLPIRLDGRVIPLLKAYESTVDRLVEALKTGSLESYTPFVYES